MTDSQNLPVLSPWIPVVVQIALGLVTIIGSGVVSGIVTHRLNVRKDREEFLRGKLEALFQAFSQYQQICQQTISIWFLVANKKMTYQEGLSRDEKELQGVT